MPAGHWAYNSVTKLASEGIIEGYGDGTFLGNRNITRYEMAQMIAKALAKNPQGASKAELDKLAAEFREALDNLGVRVAALEKHADKVKWNGFLRYTYMSTRTEQADGSKSKTNTDRVKLRFEPTAEINSHWTARARLDADTDMKTDSGVTGDLSLVRIWAEGKYGNFAVKLGKLPMQLDTQMLFDDELSGIAVTYGKKLQGVIQAGRWNLNSLNSKIRSQANANDDTANMQSVGLIYKGGKFSANAAFHRIHSEGFTKITNYRNGSTVDEAKIWSAGLGYRFDDNFAINGQYAKNTEADNYYQAHTIQLDFKGAKRAKKGTWGLYAAYRYLGQNVALDPTYNANGGLDAGQKGWEFGAGYTLFKNVLLQAKYVTGKQLTNNLSVEKLFGRVEFFF